MTTTCPFSGWPLPCCCPTLPPACVEAAALLALTWVATGWSVWLILRFQSGEQAERMVSAGQAVAAAGPAYVALIAVVALILWRRPPRARG